MAEVKDLGVVEPKVTMEEAAKVIQEEQNKKVMECSKEIAAVLEKYQMGLQTAPTITLVPRVKQ